MNIKNIEEIETLLKQRRKLISFKSELEKDNNIVVGKMRAYEIHVDFHDTLKTLICKEILKFVEEIDEKLKLL